MKSSGLGRGLGALIPHKTTAEELAGAAIGARVHEIQVNEIKPNPRQPREHFSAQGLDDLMQSINVHGIIQPLIVLKTSGGYELISGERRLRASKLLGKKTVPAIVRTATDQQKLELALLENIQREDLNQIEEAKAYKVLSEEFNLSHEQIAERVGKSRPVISNILRLLDLPEDMQQALSGGKISYAAARALLAVPTELERRSLFARLLQGEKISSADIEKKAVPVRRVEDPNIKAIEEKLRNIFGTKVRIIRRGEKGSISIDFYSNEELKSLIDRFLKRS